MLSAGIVRLGRNAAWGGVAVLAASGAWALSRGEDPSARAGLVILFEARLSASGVIKPYSETRQPSGFSMRRDLVAQGEGSFAGSRLEGILSWSLLAQKSPHEAGVRTLASGLMEMPGGEEVFFEASGFGIQPDPRKPNRWTYTASLRFQDPDTPFEWLNGIVALWQGELDLESGEGWYKAYVPLGSLPRGHGRTNHSKGRDR